MQKYFEILNDVRLFDNIGKNEIASMMTCLGAKVEKFSKDDSILMAGEAVSHIGIVLNGSVNITKDDIEGERLVIAALGRGDFFAEALCCVGVKESPVNVIASAASEIMLIPFQRILHSCTKACSFHSQLIENMLFILATKNLNLQNRMDFISKKTIRSKIISYLKSFEASQGKNIIIPFNREELADFLCVDRSALSHELSKLKKEGILDYKKNHFTFF